MAAKGAAKGTLNAKNLEALGSARLAELLMTLCEGNNASKRLLRLALAEHKGPLEMARELRKRLASIARAGSLLDDHQRDELLRELERQRQAICGPIAAHDADLAVDLLWEVMELSGGLIERCDDRDAELRDWFHQASAALGQVALAARGKPQNLADQVYAAVVSNSYGQFDPIVRDLAPALGPEGLAHLRLRLEILRQRSTSSTAAPTKPDWVVSIAMLDIADALGDAGAYLAEYRDHHPEALLVPAIAAEVAERLTKAGRAEEALTLLQAADPALRQRCAGAGEWCDARLAALEALGRSDEAQAQRWEFALLELSGRHLRDYLKRLPAFEDMPAEERALDLVAEHDDLEAALWFLLHWPEPHRAARLVLAAPQRLNGDRSPPAPARCSPRWDPPAAGWPAPPGRRSCACRRGRSRDRRGVMHPHRQDRCQWHRSRLQLFWLRCIALAQTSAPPPERFEPSNPALQSLRGWRRLHIRLTLLYGGATVLALGLLALSVYQHGVTSETRNLQRRLLNTVDSLANSVEADRISALPQQQGLWTPGHRALLRRFAETARGDKDIKSIYMMRPTAEPTKLRFVVDYERDGSIAMPGDTYDASNVPMLLKGFDRPVVEEKPVRDSFGDTLSAYAPVQTLNGRSVAVLGVDVDASRLEEIRQGVLLNTAIAFGVALVLLFLATLVVAQSLRTPLTRLINAAAAISEGDLTTRIGLQRNDELGLMSQHFDLMAEQLQDREFIRDTFGRYLSSSVADEVLRQRDGISLGGEERVVTVLFTDLRGYSSISEQMSPAQVVTMLNQYLGAMNEIVDRHQGCVIEFLGDSIFAVFGAPHYRIDHAEQAMRCALAMLTRLDELNEMWRQSGLARSWRDSGITQISSRTGLHCGKVIAGNIGSQSRIKYSVIGDSVNVASRLESLNKEYGSRLLISRDVYLQLPADLADLFVDRGPIKLKGRDQVVRIYSLSSDDVGSV